MIPNPPGTAVVKSAVTLTPELRKKAEVIARALDEVKDQVQKVAQVTREELEAVAERYAHAPSTFLAAIVGGVVGSAGEVRGQSMNGVKTVPENRSRGRQRGADRSSRSLDHLRRPWKTDPPLRIGRQRTGRDGFHVPAVVHQSQVVPRNRIRHVQIAGRQHALRDQPLADEAVLRHRKSMMLGQGQDERIRVERLHGC